MQAAELLHYKRIMIIGNNGCGKSFFARELATLCGLPLIHLDKEFWGPGWQQPSEREWIARQKQLIKGAEWIIEGNHTGTMELRFRAADAVVFLDINRTLCLISLLRRRGKKRPDMPSYLEEKMDRGFLLLCKGLWDFRKKRLPIIMGLQARYPSTPFIAIKGRRRLNRLLAQWREEAVYAEIPNAETLRVFAKTDKNTDVKQFSNEDDMFEELEI